MSKLFKNENSDAEEELKINTDYASNYNTWRQKEELHKLKARYGEDIDVLQKSDEESTETSEDDEGEEMPEEFEKNFYKTLACLKNKDPRIYNENVKFFDESQENKNEVPLKSKEKKNKLYLRDYERKIMIERGGKYSDSEDENNEKKNKINNLTYVQEQQALKDSFKKILYEDNETDEFLLKPKSKTLEESQKEEKDYKKWLKGQKQQINEEQQKDLKPLRDFWVDPNLDDKEKFLRDYILNKQFLGNDATDDDFKYDNKIHDSDDNLSEDERNINKQEEFEHKYNFRFEEPDQEFIKRYPRTLENSLRKKDTRRAQKRAEVKIRKEKEKLTKKEELKQLKALKRKEIEEKIEKLKEITGNDDLQLNMMDLEADFDPDEYDKKMNQIFNEEYYAGEEGDIKPEFPDIDKELDLESAWDNYDPTADKIDQEEIPYYEAPHCEDQEFNMDADYDENKHLQHELEESNKKKKRKRRSKFAEMISKEKPKFDPIQHSSYKEYYDQYYALDYEDMIGDLPCRFKYREVVPNDYGLSIEEILAADDKELNKWCSLKKALEHKPEYKELNDVKVYKQKAANEALKKKILKSLYSVPEEDIETPSISQQTEEITKKKRKRKKKSGVSDEVKINEIENGVASNTEKFSKEQENCQQFVKADCKVDKSLNNMSKDEKEKINQKKRKYKETQEGNCKSKEVINNKKKKVQNGVSKSSKSISEQSINKNKDNIKEENKSTKKQTNMNKNILSKKEKRKQLFLKKNKNKKNTEEVDQIGTLSEERLKAYGINPKKFKNKLKYMKKKIKLKIL